MKTFSHNETAVEAVPTNLRPALAVLYEAFQYADQTSGDEWEFAVEINQLAVLGLAQNDFRWLVRKGLVEHQREVTLEGDDGRAFRPTGDLTFPDATCFILTVAGVSVACGLCAAATNRIPSFSSATEDEHVGATISGKSSGELNLPTWDSEMRSLRINGMTVKRFKSTAANQETILAAFEEEGWPHRIDDPLPPQHNQDSKRRLSDTIKGLNRKQKHALLRFHGDGTGEGVTWELVGQTGSHDRPSD